MDIRTFKRFGLGFKRLKLAVVLVMLAMAAVTLTVALSDVVWAQSEETETRLMASHSPVYPQAGESVTYTANGKSALGIKRIRIWVKRYNVISLGPFGLFFYGPPTEWEELCDFTSRTELPEEASCTLTIDSYNTNSYIWYSAAMRLSNDTLIWDRNIRHAANLSSGVKAAYDYAIPVYRRGLKSEKFNILFVGDIDYGSAGPYITDIGDFVFNGYFSEDHLKLFRRFFNIYMNDYSFPVDVDNPDGSGCSDSTLYSEEPGNWGDLSGFDVRVYIRDPPSDDDQDCAQIGLGEGRRASADGPDVVNMESLHALAGLDDEYVTDETTSDATGPHKNVFDSLFECLIHGISHGDTFFDSSGCRLLGSDSVLYHWDDSGDVMTDSGAGPLVFGQEEFWQLWDLINDQGLSAFSTVLPNQSQVSNDHEKRLNVLREANKAIKADNKEVHREQLQKTLLLNLIFQGPKITLEKTKIVRGSAPHLFFPYLVSDYQVLLLNKQGKVLNRFWTQDPRRIGTEEKDGKDLGKIDNVRFDLRVPWMPTLARLIIQNRHGQTLLDTPINPVEK